MGYLIYDCEILNLVPTDGKYLSGYRYCGGWYDHAGMGVSVVGVCRSDMHPDHQYLHWADGHDIPLQDWFVVPEGFEVIGFNSRKFDDRLMAAHGVNIQTTYDLLQEILIAAGQNDRPYWKEGRSYALGKVGEANGFPKTGTGELAPKLWQDGKCQQVIDYCLNDVRITHELLRLGWSGKLIDPNDGHLLTLRSID